MNKICIYLLGVLTGATTAGATIIFTLSKDFSNLKAAKLEKPKNIDNCLIKFFKKGDK